MALTQMNGSQVPSVMHVFLLSTPTMSEIDFEAELATILQQEIWKEITATTGMTQQDLDNEVIAALVKLRDAPPQDK